MEGKVFTVLLFFVSPLACLQVFPSSIVVPRSPISPLVPANYLRYPSLLPYSASNNARVICSACSCDDDFFCAFNCGKCSTPSFCSSCSCLSSLGCGRNCPSCQPAQEAPANSSPSSPGFASQPQDQLRASNASSHS